MNSSMCLNGDSLPELSNLPIPQNITFAVIPGRNTSDAAMVSCCAPNPVQLAEGCYEWCELPDTYKGGGISSSFGSCLTANHRNLNSSRILGVHTANSAAGKPGVTVTGLGMLALLASTFFLLA
ncbi:hypothetical protein EsH8_VI_000336 [Colletotrichum jinshuiense]